jgi:hypothetical protein
MMCVRIQWHRFSQGRKCICVSLLVSVENGRGCRQIFSKMLEFCESHLRPHAIALYARHAAVIRLFGVGAFEISFYLRSCLLA